MCKPQEQLAAGLYALMETFEPGKPKSTRRESVPAEWEEVSDLEHMPQNPRVSVLVTAYNNAATLERAVKSVVGQRTSFPFEVLIGVDACADDSWKVAQSCCRRWPDKVRAFHPSLNVGYEANRRHLYAKSRATGGFRGGGYFAYCEADDAWDVCDTKLEEQVALLEKEHDCIACVGSVRIYERGRLASASQPAYHKHKIPRYQIGGLMFHTTTFLIPRETRETCHKLAPGLPTWMDLCILRVLSCVGPIAYWPKVGSTYYHTGEGMYDQLGATQRLTWASRHIAELLEAGRDPHIPGLAALYLFKIFKPKTASSGLWEGAPELMQRIMKEVSRCLPWTPRGILVKLKIAILRSNRNRLRGLRRLTGKENRK